MTLFNEHLQPISHHALDIIANNKILETLALISLLYTESFTVSSNRLFLNKAFMNETKMGGGEYLVF